MENLERAATAFKLPESLAMERAATAFKLPESLAMAMAMEPLLRDLDHHSLIL